MWTFCLNLGKIQGIPQCRRLSPSSQSSLVFTERKFCGNTQHSAENSSKRSSRPAALPGCAQHPLSFQACGKTKVLFCVGLCTISLTVTSQRVGRQVIPHVTEYRGEDTRSSHKTNKLSTKKKNPGFLFSKPKVSYQVRAKSIKHLYTTHWKADD